MNRNYKRLILAGLLIVGTSAFAQSHPDDSSTAYQSDRTQPPWGDQRSRPGSLVRLGSRVCDVSARTTTSMPNSR